MLSVWCDNKRFIHKHNCEGINYLFEKNNRKNFDENNLEIALNLLHSKNDKIYGPSFWKQNWSRAKDITVLMIPKEKDDIIFQWNISLH